MRKGWFVLLIVTVCALLIAPALRSQTAPLDSGFQLRTLEYNGSRFTVAIVDLKKVQLKLFWKDANAEKLGSLECNPAQQRHRTQHHNHWQARISRAVRP